MTEANHPHKRPIDRLEQYIASKGMSDSAFEKSVPLANGYISKLRKGAGNIGIGILNRIKSKHPDLNVTWVLTEVGNMEETPSGHRQAAHGLHSSSSARFEKPTLHVKKPDAVSVMDASELNVYEIPVFDFILTPQGEISKTGERENPAPSYFMNIPDFYGCYAFIVFSDSMEPRIPTGSKMFCRNIAKWQDFLETGRVYDIRLSDSRRLLRIVETSEQTERLLLKADNDKYKPLDLPKDVISEVWLVEGWLVKSGL